jgi:hypothetical protein
MLVLDASMPILLAKVDLLRSVGARWTLRIPGTVKNECLKNKSPDALLIAALIEEQRIRVRFSGQIGRRFARYSESRAGPSSSSAMDFAVPLVYSPVYTGDVA